MRLEFTPDEILLALVSMIQVTRPALLNTAGDAFDVDIAPLLAQQKLNDEEQLVLRLYALLSGGQDKAGFAADFTVAEAELLGSALRRVEAARVWPADAAALCRRLRRRLEDSIGGPAPVE